jgi:basic membrane protein A
MEDVMKKNLFALLTVVIMLAFISGCAPAAAPAAAAPTTAAAPAEAAAPTKAAAPAEAAKGGEVALLISAAGTLDDRAFNQGVWNGVKKFGAEVNKTYAYYQPVEDTVEAQVTLADTAIKAGAKFIIINSDQFKAAASKMIVSHPDVSFIMFDSVPVDESGKQVITDNLLAIQFAEQQSTFLAGYAAVKDGYTKLGFMGGMPVPAVVRFGYGFVAGIDAACQEMGLKDVEIKYNYSGDFKPTPENQARAASWFQGGTQIIHVAAGPMGASVFAAAEQNNGVVIGVDSDQSGESKTIVTSAIKDLERVTYNTLKDWNDGKFKGGKIAVYTAKEGGVALVSMKFKTFNQTMYDELYKKLADDVNGISSAIPTDKSYESPDQIPLKCAKLTYVK